MTRGEGEKRSNNTNQVDRPGKQQDRFGFFFNVCRSLCLWRFWTFHLFKRQLCGRGPAVRLPLLPLSRGYHVAGHERVLVDQTVALRSAVGENLTARAGRVGPAWRRRSGRQVRPVRRGFDPGQTSRGGSRSSGR